MLAGKRETALCMIYGASRERFRIRKFLLEWRWTEPFSGRSDDRSYAVPEAPFFLLLPCVFEDSCLLLAGLAVRPLLREVVGVLKPHNELVHVLGLRACEPGRVDEVEREVVSARRCRLHARLIPLRAVVGHHEPAAIRVVHRDHVAPIRRAQALHDRAAARDERVGHLHGHRLPPVIHGSFPLADERLHLFPGRVRRRRGGNDAGDDEDRDSDRESPKWFHESLLSERKRPSCSRQPFQPLLCSSRISTLTNLSCVRTSSVERPRSRNSTVTIVSSVPRSGSVSHFHV